MPGGNSIQLQNLRGAPGPDPKKKEAAAKGAKDNYEKWASAFLPATSSKKLSDDLLPAIVGRLEENKPIGEVNISSQPADDSNATWMGKGAWKIFKAFLNAFSYDRFADKPGQSLIVYGVITATMIMQGMFVMPAFLIVGMFFGSVSSTMVWYRRHGSLWNMLKGWFGTAKNHAMEIAGASVVAGFILLAFGFQLGVAAGIFITLGLAVLSVPFIFHPIAERKLNNEFAEKYQEGTKLVDLASKLADKAKRYGDFLKDLLSVAEANAEGIAERIKTTTDPGEKKVLEGKLSQANNEVKQFKEAYRKVQYAKGCLHEKNPLESPEKVRYAKDELESIEGDVPNIGELTQKKKEPPEERRHREAMQQQSKLRGEFTRCAQQMAQLSAQGVHQPPPPAPVGQPVDDGTGVGLGSGGSASSQHRGG